MDGCPRREARGYEVALLAVVLPAAAALALALFGDTKSTALLLLGLLFAEGAVIGLLAARLRATRDQPEGQGTATTAQELRAEIATLDRLGLTMAGHLDLERLVKAVADVGVAVTGAAFGAFLYRDGSGVWTHSVSGAPPEAFVDFPLAQDAEAFGSPFQGTASRSDDLTCDPCFGPNLPFRQMPPGLSPARSFLAAPVRSGAGDLLGGLFFGHPDPGVFHPRDERLVAGLAAHAAIAVDNAHLYQEAQEARRVAEAAGRVKDEFLATLSHELRTPLTAIVGWAHLLKGGRLDRAEVGTAVETIIRNANAQNQIIDQLLDVSRIVTGKLQLSLQPVEIGSVVTSAIGTVTPAASAKGVLLQLIQDPAGSAVLGNPERLQQVFWNLLSNAVKFTPKNGRVRVSVESVGSQVEVAVSDTGLGIDAVFLPHVFNRFSQRDSSSTRSARGLGLGLAIARELVELHGGSIQAESPGPGQGSTFTVKFPRSPVTAPPANGRVYSQANRSVGLDDAPDLTGIRVPIVEDDDDARALVAKVLQDQGAQVDVVASAREALDVLASERVDATHRD